MKVPIGPDPVREAVRVAMEARGLNPRSLAALTLSHDPSGKGLSDTALREWLTGQTRLTTERAGWVMAAMGLAVVSTGDASCP